MILAGCGRIAFDGSPGVDGGPGDDAPTIDAAADSSLVRRPAMFQDANGSSAAGTTLTIPWAAPVTDGSTIVVATLNFNAGAVAASTIGVRDDAGQVYVSANARATWTGTAGQVEIWYLPRSGPGPTKVSIDSSDATSRSAWLLEVANLDPDVPLDAVGVINNAATNGAPPAPMVIPTRSPALIVSVILITGAVTQIAAGNDFIALGSLNGDAAAYAIVDAAGTYGAVWDAPGSDNYGSSTAAFLGAD